MRERSGMHPESRPNLVRSLNQVREFLGRPWQLEEVSDTAGVRHQCGGLRERSGTHPERGPGQFVE